MRTKKPPEHKPERFYLQILLDSSYVASEPLLGDLLYLAVLLHLLECLLDLLAKLVCAKLEADSVLLLKERVGQSLISICGDMRVISLILKLSFHQYLPSAFAILFQTKQHAHCK